jgi:hypothetical protein
MQCLSIDSEQLIASLVGVLLHGRSPSAVAWAVTTRIVNAVKRTSVGARAHVLSEEPGIVPALADVNSSAAIQTKIFIIFVVASSHHALPGFVERMAKHPVFNSNWWKWFC